MKIWYAVALTALYRFEEAFRLVKEIQADCTEYDHRVLQYGLLAEIYLLDGRLDDAQAMLDHAPVHEGWANLPRFYTYCARLHIARNNYDKAGSHWKQVYG